MMVHNNHHDDGSISHKQNRVGQNWSGTNPIPTISEFRERLEHVKLEQKAHEEAKAVKERERGEETIPASERERGEEAIPASGTENNEEAMAAKERDRDEGVTPHKSRKKPKGKTRMVFDPTSGRDMEVEDHAASWGEAAKNPKLLVPNANLGEQTNVKTHPCQSLAEYKENQDITAPPDPIAEGTASDVPIHGEKTNVLFHPTPSVTYQPMYDLLEKRAVGVCFGILFGVIFLGRYIGSSLWGLILIASCAATGVWLWMQEVIRSGRDMEWRSEQLRGQTATVNLIPESVEWMNTLLGIVWGLVNPDMLAPIADTIEDIMQTSVPGAVENVRIAEIDQGSNPLRILSMRALPDGHVQHHKNNTKEDNKRNKDPQEAAAAEEGASYYNMEASFAYHAKPTGQSTSSKASNMHMQIIFYLGIRGLFGVPFPVFVELAELVGTVRLRFQMMPEPPFMKELTFSLVGIPRVRARCMPMVKGGVNILDLPIISNFVNYAIGTACSLFAAPKSMTMDLDMMLRGDDILKDTQALGVMWIRIHRAVGLSKQDKRGSEGGGSDPYINLSFSKYGKPMYCTRVITDDLNPVWEETAGLLVTPELIKADENLSVELWDSDRTTADDIVGKVELPIRDMLQHPGRMYPQVSKLRGLNEGSEMPGELHWEVGFFGKPKLRPELRTDGKKKDLPKNLKDVPEFQDEKGTIVNEEEDAVVHTPPDPLWPSGILSVVVHQIVNLQLTNISGSDGNRKGREYEPAKPYGETTEEEGKSLPTSYCNIILNDELTYRTRAKAVSSKPIFNAGTERFVRDWRSAIVVVTVRDQRYREHDPILGLVPLKLTDIFETSSQVTRWYPLDGGIGHGRIRISLLFRHVELKLPPNMLGWSVGTFEFSSDKIMLRGFNHRTKIKLRTGGSSGKIPRRLCHVEGNDSYFDVSDEDFRHSIQLPVKYRYRSPIVFELHTQGKHGAAGYAILWLQHLVDNEETSINIPIWSTKNGARLTQNYITEENWKLKESPGLEDLQIIGRLQLRCCLTPGINEIHEHFVVDSHSRETFESWEACIAEGVRPRKISGEIPEDIQRLHEESLRSGREELKRLTPRERRRWVDKHGQDWSGAFGHDPRAYLSSEGRKVSEPGRDEPAHDPVHPPADIDVQSTGSIHIESDEASSNEYDTENELQQRHSLPESSPNGEAGEEAESSYKETKRANRRTAERQQRGLMQWKPARNMVFARDEAKFALRKVKRKFSGGLTGREPDIETETNQ